MPCRAAHGANKLSHSFQRFLLASDTCTNWTFLPSAGHLPCFRMHGTPIIAIRCHHYITSVKPAVNADTYNFKCLTLNCSFRKLSKFGFQDSHSRRLASIMSMNIHNMCNTMPLYTSASLLNTADRQSTANEKSDDASRIDESPESHDIPKLSQKERIKKAMKDYGSIVVIFHITLALSWLGASYMLVSNGVDVVSILYKLGFQEEFVKSKMGAVATGTSTFVVSYAFYKIFAPVRIGITLSVTPLLVRYLRNIGILRKAPGVGR